MPGIRNIVLPSIPKLDITTEKNKLIDIFLK